VKKILQKYDITKRAQFRNVTMHAENVKSTVTSEEKYLKELAVMIIVSYDFLDFFMSILIRKDHRQ
jgi:predicted enzyme involved in methoxymalonyl-ACP biosynthesis